MSSGQPPPPAPNSALVYSTDGGRVRPAREAPASARRPASGARPPDDGVVRIARAKRGGGGKTVLSVTGLPGSEADLDRVLQRCKVALGVGGSRDGRALYFQGEQRERLLAELRKLGFKPKLAGG